MANYRKRGEFMEELHGELYEFSRKQPRSTEEVIYYLAKAKLILEEHTTAIRMFEKEPNVAEACLANIQRHISDYYEKYPHAKESDEETDPWPDYDSEDTEDDGDDFFDALDEEGDDDDSDFFDGLDEPCDTEEYEDEYGDIFSFRDLETGEEELYRYLADVYLEDENGVETGYIALMPYNPEAEEDVGEVMFLRVSVRGDEEESTYYGVDDEELANILFEKFKEENKDRFTFEE